MYRLPLINSSIHTYVSFILKPPSIGTLRFSLSLSQTPCGKQIVRTLFINSGCQKSIMQKNKDFLQEKSNRRKIRHAIEETWISPAVVNLKIPCAPPIEKVQQERKGVGGYASSIKLNWPLPYRTGPVTRLRDTRPAGWVTYCSIHMLEYNAESPKQGRKGFNSIVKTIYFYYLPIFIYASPPPFPFPSPPPHLIVLYGTVGKVVKIPLSCTEKYWI